MTTRQLCAVVALVCLVSSVRGQTPKMPPAAPPPGAAGHHEVPRDPYMPATPGPVTTDSPAVLSRDGQVSVQVNVNAQGLNIVGDAANEPSIAVDPTDPNRMVIGWRQFDTISSDFRQAGNAYTTDNGATWTFPGVIEPGVFRSDPVLDADSNGVFYYNSLTASGNDFWCHVFRSYDGGATWDSGTYAWGGDKQWQAIDRTGGPGDGHIYAAWNSVYSACYGKMFTRSTDGGNTYEDCIEATGTPFWGVIDIGPDGEVYICGNGFVVSKSTNAQYAAQTPTWTATTVDLDGTMSYSGGPNPGGLLGQSWIATDHSDGPTRGNVYLLCSVQRASTPDPLDVMFSRSTDGGQTWSMPVRVNDDATDTAYQWFGTMSVAPNGRIDVVWLDTRNDPGGYLSELYYSYSYDAGYSWAPSRALSPAFDPHVGWPQQNKMGDYFDMISDNGGARLAYAATFNGEQDVYYTYASPQIAMAFPSGLPDIIAPGTPTQIDVQISPGNETYVVDSGQMYYRLDPNDPYTAVPLTPAGGESFTVTLPALNCGDQLEYYFVAEGDESGVIYRPPGAPANTYTAAVGELVTFWSENLSSNPGWNTQGLWAYGAPAGLGGAYGNPDPITGHTGPNVYGYNLQGDYENDLVERHLTSGPIDCTGKTGTKLGFWRYLGVETPRWDHAYVRVSNNGVTWDTVWENVSEVADDQWTYVEYDISPWADDQATVYLRWTMGTTDSAWTYCGWNIDDISLSAVVCEAGAGCPGDANCDGFVNFRDIDYFVAAQNDNVAAWEALFGGAPPCDFLNNDTNGDGFVNFRDIDPFVALQNTSCP